MTLELLPNEFNFNLLNYIKFNENEQFNYQELQISITNKEWSTIFDQIYAFCTFNKFQQHTISRGSQDITFITQYDEKFLIKNILKIVLIERYDNYFSVKSDFKESGFNEDNQPNTYDLKNQFKGLVPQEGTYKKQLIDLCQQSYKLCLSEIKSKNFKFQSQIQQCYRRRGIPLTFKNIVPGEQIGNIVLRDWQVQYLEFFKKEALMFDKQILTAPTGAGKTIMYLIIAFLAQVPSISICCNAFMRRQLDQQIKATGLHFENRLTVHSKFFTGLGSDQSLLIIDDLLIGNRDFVGLQNSFDESRFALIVSHTENFDRVVDFHLANVQKFFSKVTITNTAIENQNLKIPLKYYYAKGQSFGIFEVFKPDQIIQRIKQSENMPALYFYLTQVRGFFQIDPTQIIQKYIDDFSVYSGDSNQQIQVKQPKVLEQTQAQKLQQSKKDIHKYMIEELGMDPNDLSSDSDNHLIIPQRKGAKKILPKTPIIAPSFIFQENLNNPLGDEEESTPDILERQNPFLIPRRQVQIKSKKELLSEELQQPIQHSGTILAEEFQPVMIQRFMQVLRNWHYKKEDISDSCPCCLGMLPQKGVQIPTSKLDEYIQDREVVLFSCAHMVCKSCCNQIKRIAGTQDVNCPTCKQKILQCYIYNIIDESVIEQDVLTFFQFQNFITDKQYQDLFDLDQNVVNVKSELDMVEKMVQLEGKKVYINFETSRSGNFVTQYYKAQKMEIDVIKSIANRVNWVFKHDLTIPLNVFDKMIGINMNSFQHVVLLCRNYVAYGDKMLQQLNRFCRSERQDLTYHIMLIE